MKVRHVLLQKFAKHHINPIESPHLVTYNRVRSFLQTSGYSGMFAHIPQIISILTNRPPPRFTEEQREIMINIFLEVQEPYELHKGSRSNFVAYGYVTYKICELLGLREFLPLLSKLDEKNLLKADRIWKLVCRDLRYQFIPTI